jgi:xanthine dehydrogenase YagR molybdenum-binding subunit
MSTHHADNTVALENTRARVDIVEKVTGRAKYTSDFYPANLLWTQLIRCPAGKADIAGSDLTAARAVPGVLEIELTKNAGNYHGQPVGHVVAESRQALEDALAALKIQWTRQAAVTRLREAARPADDAQAKNMEQVKSALAADGIKQVAAVYETQVQTHCCLEPHGVVVDFRGDHAIAWGSTQATFGFRDQIAEALGLAREKVEFHCEYIGGGFGSKFEIGEEGALAARISKKYRRPARGMLTRKEEMLDAGMRPGSLQTMNVGVAADGTIKAARIHIDGSVGYEGGGGGAANPARYRFGVVGRSAADVNLNSQFPRAMRAPGHPQGMFAVEMMMDELAASVGMDPLEFRLKNDPNPVRQEMYREGARLIGWERRKPDGTSSGAIKTGFGVGATDWGNGPGGATVDVLIHRSGQVEVFSGSQDIGTGFRTLLTDIVASQIGIPRKFITVQVGVSSLPFGPGSGGSVTSRFVAPKAFGAAEKVKQQVLKAVAQEWKIDPATLQVKDGAISGGSQNLTWPQACKLLTQDSVKASESEDGSYFGAPTGSEGVQLAEVQVDTETGIVRVIKVVALQDVGLPINRNTIENQITGAVIQGLSFALFEERILNRQTGSVVNANMDLYKIAGSLDIPEIIPVIWRSSTQAGANSLGEPPSVPMPGVLGCAVANAIGARVRSLPLTPDKILTALAAAPAREGSHA